MRRNTEADFWAKVDRSGSSCWLWIARPNSKGYGELSFGGSKQKAHRVAYTLLRGEIPEGLHLDHLCRNRLCVNPDHLEPVTLAENIRRGITSYVLRTRCKAGLHDITDPSNIVSGAHGRQCRACKQISRDKYNARQAATS